VPAWRRFKGSVGQRFFLLMPVCPGSANLGSHGYSLALLHCWPELRGEEPESERGDQTYGIVVGLAVRRMRFWLVVRDGVGRLELRTTEFTDGRRALSVFSFEKEAKLFLRRCISGGWRVRAAGVGELVSVLSGPYRELELVALDPLPQRRAEALNTLLCVNRERFVDFLLRQGVGP
jgi:hypothetical protein